MFSLVTSSSRGFRPCSTILFPFLTRSLVNRALTKPIPPATVGTIHLDAIVTPNDFLKSIGRSMETKMTSVPESWDDFWRTSGLDMRKAGLGVRDRRYTLWCMSKFRRGLAVKEFAHEPKPKKTVRGWGPSVQNGKRIRSKRPKNQKRK
ncbi:IGR protein motif-domain-containing protein [Lentinula aciculospora]|uniref:Small ribosomal subunit protein mS41 n=1 Tax=Lentinula aciculospora TaxID=153920 RepID=A0A9W9AHK4_9AGAR|nr:IGR protein motif-domain-containing protein [Lentinula aciculospora]